jgi:hypothetical protein
MEWREKKGAKMSRKLIPVWSVILLLAGCASMQASQGNPQAASARPVITQAFAAPEMRTGDAWKIYLNASDPNGDMEYIVATVDQPGRGGGYPPSFTRIKTGEHQELSGYVYLNTANNVQQGLNFTNLTLTVQIKDRNGNMSNPVSLPLHFQLSALQQPPPPGVFHEANLGPVMIQIRPLGDGGKQES